MIQRIQTLYLLVVSALSWLMLAMPLGRFIGEGNGAQFVLGGFGLAEVGSAAGGVVTWPMGILIVMAAVLPLVAVFLFKRRMLQVRLCFMEIVFQMGILAFVAFYFYQIDKAVGGVHTFAIADIFPVVGIVFSWLALRAIMKDEVLVRSVNRIR